MKNFYVGKRSCGCITAALVDDDKTTPDEIAEFARSMKGTQRRVEHLSLPLETPIPLVHCTCKKTAAIGNQ